MLWTHSNVPTGWFDLILRKGGSARYPNYGLYYFRPNTCKVSLAVAALQESVHHQTSDVKQRIQ